MGLIKAAVSSISNQIGDQFKEFITCPAAEKDVIIQRGVVSHGVGNTNPTPGVISNGSGIAVPQGWSMMIIDNGEIVEFTDEVGTYTYDSSSEPSIFCGSLGKSVLDSIKTIGKRITYGGQPAKDQRVYYVRTMPIPGNTFGSQQPETIFDPVYGSVEITYNGEYAIKVDDPVILVNNYVGANPEKDTLKFDDIFANQEQGGTNQLKAKFTQKVSECIATIMSMHNVSFNKIQMYKSDVTNQMNNMLDEEWHSLYGIVVTDVALRINASEESRKIVQEMDAKVAETTRMGQVYSNNMAGTMAAATGESMKAAASNENGSMMGFMGMGFAQQQGANVLNSVGNMQGAPAPAPEAPAAPAPGTVFGAVTPAAPVEAPAPVETPAEPAPAASAPAFCPDCGAPKVGKFCTQCGKKLD